ncbi:MAG: hypothetical protein Q4B03_01490 [Lachnospiraceae bacterium]|nr:hypothetical protein [Lachnospiraceae bacterium]
MNWNEIEKLRPLLEKDEQVILADIRALYQKLDERFHLRGARIPITFGFDEDVLGSYTPGNGSNMEHFHFSLLFTGYSVENPLKRSDRLDLYLHEYAHYMQYNMEIPREYQFKPGIHGSAWIWCCSLIGAVPSPYYKVGESLRKQDYKRKLRNPINDPHVQLKDTRQREKEYQDSKNRVVQFKPGEVIRHPSYGEGSIEQIEQLTGSVRLHIRFGEELKKIDQQWLLKAMRKPEQTRR